MAAWAASAAAFAAAWASISSHFFMNFLKIAAQCSDGNAPTLSLDLTPSANLGAFIPGVGKDYEATVAATVTSSAGDATLTVADPNPTAAGRLTNGSFALAQPVMARANQGVFAAITAAPLTLLTYAAPVSAGPVTIGLKQTIGANEPLRTGTYGKTLTFTLSTTTP